MDVGLKTKLQEIVPLDSGGSYKLLWDMLYHIRLLKYVRQSHLKIINSRYTKICAVKKLDTLVQIGLLKNPDRDIYISTAKSFDLLKEVGYDTRLLPKNIDGNGGVNEINNTEVFIQALKLPDFKMLLYPNFDYLRPDALLVRQIRNNYKLEFLEVEASKPNWTDWLENKRINYLQLASSKDAFQYWKERSYLLDIPPPDIKDFKFSVSFIGKMKIDFGKGFNFMETI